MSSNNVRPHPLTIEEITKEWLQAALRTKVPDLELRDFEIVSMLRSTSTKIFIRLDLNDAGKRAGIPRSVVLKGGFEPHSRHLWYMHEKEARHYRDLMPNLPLRIPGCYFADYDPERQQGIIIIEDLVARGVTFCSALKPDSYEAVARRLEALAEFHAKSWNSPNFLPGNKWDWVDNVPVTFGRYFDELLDPEMWNGWITSPQGAAMSVRLQDRNWARHALHQMMILSSRLPHVILHGDLHLGNLYVDTDGAPGFFDCLAGRSPAMLDVAYHVACALDSFDRRRWEGALIQRYLLGLRKHGVEMGFDEAMYQYAVFLGYAYCIWIMNDPTAFQTSATNTAYTARINAAMLDNRSMELLDQIK
jgi:hypothetical protein